MQLGDVISWQRTFTEQEIRDFARLSGDQGEHHLVHDEQGRLMAHGLLTATLPTKVGGDMNIIARLMSYDLHRPAFSGDTIQCEVKLVVFTTGESSSTVVAHFVCPNQSGNDVMPGQLRGVIKNT